MKIAIFSDIHANFTALNQAFIACEKLGIYNYWFLGDVVGRGPDPNSCIKWLIQNVHKVDKESWIIGNHEAFLLNLFPDEIQGRLNSEAKYVFSKHWQNLSSDNETLAFVQKNFTVAKSKPILKIRNGINHILTHGGLGDYPNYPYLFPWLCADFCGSQIEQATQAFDLLKPSVVWYGHTHIPSLISVKSEKSTFKPESTKIIPGTTYPLNTDTWWIINPGSIGQPRNLDPNASFAILDDLDFTITFMRIRYNTKETIQMMRENQYPIDLIESMSSASFNQIPEDWAEHFIKVRLT